MSKKKGLFRVFEGRASVPKEDWDEYITLTEDPQYIEEYYVRRFNWDSRWNAKHSMFGITDDPRLRRMAKVPDCEDYLARHPDDTIFLLESQPDFYRARLVDKEIHYYKTKKDAEADRVTVVAFKRFLRANLEYREEAVARLCTEHGIEYTDDMVFGVATSVEEIQRIYRDGPRSCMSGSDGTRQTDVAGYGLSPDFGVAYMERDNRVVSRALVNVTTKEYFRDGVYGASEQLIHKLKAEGYTDNTWLFAGCKFVPNKYINGREAFPYFDFRYYDMIKNDDGTYTFLKERPNS